jgi:putative hydrolase of the HAD superfamily
VIDALLFDLGRVIIELDTERMHARWAELAGMSAAEMRERVADRVSASEAFRKHERGEIDDAEFFAHLRSALEVELTDEQLADGWNAIFVGEMPGIRSVLARIDGRLPLYVLSNTNAMHQACWSVRFADVLARFRKIYVSHDMGARKPEPEAFKAVVTDMGVAPERVLFFDDIADNVAGAEACGLQAVHVRSAADVEVALGRWLGPLGQNRSAR